MKNILLNDEKLKQISKNTNEIYSYLTENNYEFIRDLISKSENLLFNNYEEESKYSGTTCNLVIIIGKKVICANIGDSRAFMVKNHKTIIELSSDQKPDNPSEKERIESKGGEIRQYIENNEPIGPMRVFKKNENYPGIAMARSIGDKLADLIGVISEPEIKEFDIDINCKYIICGSDGIFEFLTNEKIAHIINKYYKKNDPKECCDVIIKKSVELWNKYDTVVDDHSIIIIFFNQ
jgi:serine/threonine protein phosphatase PrpC